MGKKLTTRLITVLAGLLIIGMVTGCSPKKTAEQAEAEAQVAELTAKLEKMESSQKQRREHGVSSTEPRSGEGSPLERGGRRGNSDQATTETESETDTAEDENMITLFEESIKLYASVVQQLASNKSLEPQAEKIKKTIDETYRLIREEVRSMSAEEQNKVAQLLLQLQEAKTMHDNATTPTAVATTPTTQTTPQTTAPASTTTTQTGTPASSIVFPAGTTTIANYAYQNKGLTGNLTIPNGITELGQSAFENNQLTSVVIPNSVTIIGEIVVMDGFGRTSLYSNTFANNKITNVTLGNKVEIIGPSAFADNQLTSITIPSSVRVIGDNAFKNNKITGTLVIPNGVVEIGSDAFDGNPITEVIIPNSVTKIDGINNVTTGDRLVGFNPFPSTITKITIGGGIKKIYNGTFKRYSKLTTLILQEGIEEIGSGTIGTLDGAFESCNLRGHLTIPDSVTSIGANAFGGGTKNKSLFGDVVSQNQLTSVTIGKNVVRIGDGAFYHNLITEVTIPASVRSIGSQAFRGLEKYVLKVTFEGSNVQLNSSFTEDLDDVYKKGGAGTYVRKWDEQNLGYWVKQ